MMATRRDESALADVVRQKVGTLYVRPETSKDKLTFGQILVVLPLVLVCVPTSMTRFMSEKAPADFPRITDLLPSGVVLVALVALRHVLTNRVFNVVGDRLLKVRPW